MTLQRHTDPTLGQFLATGTVPLAATTNNTFSARAAGFSNFSSLRLRTDLELYVTAVGSGSANIDLRVAYETIMMVGAVAYDGGSTVNSDTPITNAVLGLNSNRIGGWGQWEYLYPEVTFVNVNTPQTALFTWRPKDKTIDTQYRRNHISINGIDLFMPWEVQDGAGLINTTTAGVTYRLGARFAQQWMWENRS